jgi:hypothetical protein
MLRELSGMAALNEKGLMEEKPFFGLQTCFRQALPHAQTNEAS